MERLSAMLQRKEQELLLAKEREAGGNAGASTLELKLLIQEKYSKLKELERKELQSVTESPQQTRSNVLGLLARRVNNANNTNNQPNKDLIRRPSIDDFMESATAFNPALSKTEVSPGSAVEPAGGYNAAMNHIRIKSGIDSPVPVNDKGEVIDTEGLVSIVDEVTSPDQGTFASSPADEPTSVNVPPPIPAIVGPNSPPGTPPIMPRTSSKKIGSMLSQQEKENAFVSSPLVSARPAAVRSNSADNLADFPAQLNVPLPSQNQFKTLRKGDWGLPDKQPLNSAEIREALDPSAYSVPSDDRNDGSDVDGSPRESAVVASVSKVQNPLTLERNLVLEGPAWTVATISSLKECYLFLFNDILVITKPYERRSSKRIYFKPSSVINLSTSRLTFNDPKARHPNNGLLLIDQETRHKIETVVSRTFESHPVKSVSYLISKGVFPRTPSAVATFLLTTPRLSKTSLGKFLALQSHALILQAYMKFLNFTNTDIVPSFRMLLCSFRLPTDESDKVDIIIDAFVERWLQCNPKSLAKILPPYTQTANVTTSPSPIDQQTQQQQPAQRHWQHDSIRQVVFGLLALDFEIHYAQASVKEESVFLNRFIRSLLPSLQASLQRRSDAASISATTCEKTHREALRHIFNSIADERLDMGEVSGDKIAGPYSNALYWIFTVENSGDNVSGPTSAPPTAPIPFTTTTPFLNLTVNAVSPLITLRISQPVPGLKIEVSGVDVKCEPRVLDFTKGACASFRVTGLSTGRKVVLFTRRFAQQEDESVDIGRGLENPAGIGVLVEPEWLKYRFAVEDGEVLLGSDLNDGAAKEVVDVSSGQVIAVSSETVFGQWEETLKKLNGGFWEKNAMELTGNNPYGTLGGPELLEASQKAIESEERSREVKKRLLSNEQPISRNALLVQCGAVLGEEKRE
ncbi:hypothetical protein HDU81_003404 [Chytriomyces hyalinus]|nr:hypothetical protein HDU81_003404 [Chytriomyces hyalinus]